MVFTISKDQARDFALACFNEIMREIKENLPDGKEEETTNYDTATP